MRIETKIAIGVVTGLVAGSVATGTLFAAPAMLRGAFLRGRVGGPAMMQGWTNQRGPGAQDWQRGPGGAACPFYGERGTQSAPGPDTYGAPDGGTRGYGRRGPGMMFRGR